MTPSTYDTGSGLAPRVGVGMQKTVSQYTHTMKERPYLRARIIREKLFPDILADNEGLVWNGFSVFVRGEGHPPHFTASGNLRKQLSLMMSQGFFGPELENVPIDSPKYWGIRDDLYTYLDKSRIASKGLFDFFERKHNTD